MPYAPMPFALQTERLELRLWEESNAAGYRRLVAERGDAMLSLDEAIDEIRDARESAPTVRTWNTPSFRVLDKLGFRRDHSTSDDRDEIVWSVLDLTP